MREEERGRKRVRRKERGRKREERERKNREMRGNREAERRGGQRGESMIECVKGVTSGREEYQSRLEWTSEINIKT